MSEGDSPSETVLHSSQGWRLLYGGLGILSTALGIIGAFLPVMPTTCFLLLALWAFSKSSPTLYQWLWAHKRFGRPLRTWQKHRCIPVEAKIAAILSMTGSLLFVFLLANLEPISLSVAIAFLVLGAFIVLRIPSTPTEFRVAHSTQDQASHQ